MHDEPNEHYITKIYCGEMLRKFFEKRLVISVEYEQPLPELITDKGPRTYQPDIYIEYTSHGDKTIYIADVEIQGPIHFKNKTQYFKNKLRRETIIKYFNNEYSDKTNPTYNIIFSYIVFRPEDFLYFKFDFFKEIFEDNFIHGGIYPTVDAYEKYIL